VDGDDPLGEVGVAERSAAGDVLAVGVEGGTGDLEQLTRPADVALLRFLRLDERPHVHRVSFTKKAVMRNSS